MASIFLSHAMKDLDIAAELQTHLEAFGHHVVVPVGTLPTGKWRDELADGLRRAEVVIVLLTRNGLASPFVSSEVGAARVYDEEHGTLLLPVIAHSDDIPFFVSDYTCFRFDGSRLHEVANDLNRAIAQHEEGRDPRIFLSHRHKDEDQVRALINLLEAAFRIENRDIRCTSIEPYRLAAGERTSERLRREIARSEVVLGVVSDDTAESRYVLAELGAAWGCDVPVLPLLAGSATFGDVPEPLSERHSISLSSSSECMQLIRDLERLTTLEPKEGNMDRISTLASSLSDLNRTSE